MNSYYVYIAMLTGSWLPPIIIGGLRFGRLDAAARIFWLNICFAFLVDCAAITAALAHQTNAQIYNIGSILYTFTVCLYMDKRIFPYVKRRIGLYLGILSVIAGALNSLFLQPFQQNNTYYRLYMVIVIVSLGLASMSLIVFRSGYTNIRKQPHFWLAAILVFFWSFMYLHLLLYDYFTLHHSQHKWLIDRSILLANMLNNLSVAVVFLLMQKKMPQRA